MLKKLLVKKKQTEIGLYLGDKQIALCQSQQGKNTLLANKVVGSDKQWQEHFISLVDQFQLGGSSISVVLGREFYQTFDIEKPKVDESELLATLPFSIKDLISESIFDQVVDYVDIPFQQRKGEQVTVICVPKNRVLMIRDMVLNAGCQLNGITIEELALARLLGEHDEANILLSQQKNELVLTVVKQGQLYFTHRLRGFNDLIVLPLEEVEDALLDGLSLEIQRALDYISSQLRINTIGALYLAVICPDIALLSEKLGSYLARNVQPFGGDNEYDFLSLIVYGAISSEAPQ
jgi:MSHA biogenesis protein MshI